MPAASRQAKLTPETIAQEARALARVLRLIGHAPEQPGGTELPDDAELQHYADQLDAIARDPGPFDASLAVLDRALDLAERTVEGFRNAMRGGPLQRVRRRLEHAGEADPAWLAEALVQRLREEHQLIAGQRGH